MILFKEEFTHSPLPDYLHRHLDELLADEYVLMNKTVNLLFSLDVVPEPEVPEKVYDELKKNIKDITSFLKLHELPFHLSINNFLEKTRLTSTPVITNCAAWFQHILSDHQYIISRINEVLNCLTTIDETYTVFNDIKLRHLKIVAFLSEYMEQVKKVFLRPAFLD